MTDLLSLALSTLEEAALESEAYELGALGQPSEHAARLREAIELVRRLSGATVSHVGIWCMEDGSKCAVVSLGLEPDKDDQTVAWSQLQTLHDAGFDLILRHTGHGPLLIVAEDIKRDWEKVRP